jgi:hypothetical protein
VPTDSTNTCLLLLLLLLLLQALLVNPSHHDELLGLVSSWPHAIFTPTKLIDSIAQRMQR